MPTLVQLIKSKTLMFSAALTILSAVQGYVGLFNLTPMQQSEAGLAIGVVIAVLRFLTTVPLSEK